MSQHKFPELVLSAQVLLNCGGGGTCHVSPLEANRHTKYVLFCGSCMLDYFPSCTLIVGRLQTSGTATALF